VSALLVSDSEREYTVGLLRTHLLSGRLSAEEFETRVDEAWRARFAADLWQALRWLPVDAPPVAARPGPSSGLGSAAGALTLSLLGLAIFCFTLGLGALLSLPLSASGWLLGRSTRRSCGPGARGTARAGEVIGVAGTLLALLAVAGCTAFIVAVT
jgi:hypothetical protein